MGDSGVSRKVKKGQIVHLSQQATGFVYYVQEGLMKIGLANEKGQEILKDIVKTGDFFGELALLENEETRDMYAVAIEDSIVSFVQVANMKDRMSKDDVFRTDIMRLLGLRMKRAEDRMHSIIFKTAKERVLGFLQDLATDFGERSGDGLRMKNFLTHEDIAKIINTSRQTVSTTLSEFKKIGVIDYNSRYMKLYNHKITGQLSN